MQVIQPGLAGPMDRHFPSAVPFFAVALSTPNSDTSFLVDLTRANVAATSLAFSESLSDDGQWSVKGYPLTKGLFYGVETFLGTVTYTLLSLLASFYIALTLTTAIVAIELWIIAWTGHSYKNTPLMKGAFQKLIAESFFSCRVILIGDI